MDSPTPAELQKLINDLPFGPEVTYRIGAVAEFLGVHERTIYRWLSTGKSARRIPRSAVIALEAHGAAMLKKANPLRKVKL